jgi:O-antigen ligase
LLARLKVASLAQNQPLGVKSADPMKPVEYFTWAVVVLLLSILSAFAGEWVCLTLVMVFCPLMFRLWPQTLIFSYLLLQPFQEVFIENTSSTIRSYDEIIVVILSATVLIPPLVRNPHRFFKDKFVFLTSLFIITSLVSGILNDVPLGVMGAGIFVTCDYLLLFLALIHMPLRPRHARLAVLTCLSLGALTCFVAMIQMAFPAFSWEWQTLLKERGLIRVTGLLKHPNDLGYFMLLVFFIAVGATMTTRSFLARFMIPLAMLAVVLSISRSSYGAVVVGFMLAGFFINRRLIKLMIGVGIGVMLLLGPLIYQAVTVRLAKIESEGGDARFTYAKKAVPVFTKAPILGVGPGRFGGTVAQKYSSPIYKQYGFRFDQTWTTIDSFWIHFLVEFGLLGTLILFSILWRILLVCRKAYAIPGLDPWVKGLLIATTMLLGAHLLINMSSMALEANTTAAPFWIIAGVVIACTRSHVAAEKMKGDQITS